MTQPWPGRVLLFLLHNVEPGSLEVGSCCSASTVLDVYLCHARQLGVQPRCGGRSFPKHRTASCHRPAVDPLLQCTDRVFRCPQPIGNVVLYLVCILKSVSEVSK